MLASSTPRRSPLSRLAGLFSRSASLRLETVAPDRRPAGHPERSSPTKLRPIVVRVDAETFDRIERGANAAGITITEAIRQLIARGLATSTGETP